MAEKSDHTMVILHETIMTSILIIIMFIFLMKEWYPPEITVFITLAVFMICPFLRIINMSDKIKDHSFLNCDTSAGPEHNGLNI